MSLDFKFHQKPSFPAQACYTSLHIEQNLTTLQTCSLQESVFLRPTDYSPMLCLVPSASGSDVAQSPTQVILYDHPAAATKASFACS